jgi:dihydrolipoamide dehydrogenase
VVAADHVLIATGATPRGPADRRARRAADPDLADVYDLLSLPSRLVVIGSGVTGAEFASAYLAAGVDVTLVSSRDRVMPHEDPTRRRVEQVFQSRGMTILANARASAVRSTGDGVVVELADGLPVEGSHALMAVGSIPNTAELGLEEYA